mmetsp:Transcript_20847/g.67150  ORF Transcript_20847/g.67150 Transcript_20847/m.67150 type:complete len:248 (+) Transcript_20847:1807-2550(+)
MPFLVAEYDEGPSFATRKVSRPELDELLTRGIESPLAKALGLPRVFVRPEALEPCAGNFRNEAILYLMADPATGEATFPWTSGIGKAVVAAEHDFTADDAKVLHTYLDDLMTLYGHGEAEPSALNFQTFLRVGMADPSKSHLLRPRVQLRNIKTKPQLNGTKGFALRHIDQKFEIRIDDHEQGIIVTLDKLLLLDDHDAPVTPHRDLPLGLPTLAHVPRGRRPTPDPFPDYRTEIPPIPPEHFNMWK